MRANYRMQRLFVPQPMVPGGAVDPDPQQAHYLLNVLRLKPGSPVNSAIPFDGAVEGTNLVIVGASESGAPGPDQAFIGHFALAMATFSG